MKDAVIDPVPEPGQASTAVDLNPMDRRFPAPAALMQGIEMVVGGQIDSGSFAEPFANSAEILKEMQCYQILLVIR